MQTLAGPPLEPGAFLNPRERPGPVVILARSETYRPDGCPLAAATGLAKLLDNRSFARVIASYQLGLPGLFLLPLGLQVPVLPRDRPRLFSLSLRVEVRASKSSTGPPLTRLSLGQAPGHCSSGSILSIRCLGRDYRSSDPGDGLGDLASS